MAYGVAVTQTGIRDAHAGEGDHYFALAADYVAAENFETAIQLYQKGLELEPESLAGNFFYAEVLLKLGRLDESLDHFRKAHDLGPQTELGARAFANSVEIEQEFAKREQAEIIKPKLLKMLIGTWCGPSNWSRMDMDEDGNFYFSASKRIIILSETKHSFGELYDDGQGDYSISISYSFLIQSVNIDPNNNKLIFSYEDISEDSIFSIYEDETYVGYQGWQFLKCDEYHYKDISSLERNDSHRALS